MSLIRPAEESVLPFSNRVDQPAESMKDPRMDLVLLTSYIFPIHILKMDRRAFPVDQVRLDVCS